MEFQACYLNIGHPCVFMKKLELKSENFTFIKKLICGFIKGGPNIELSFYEKPLYFSLLLTIFYFELETLQMFISTSKLVCTHAGKVRLVSCNPLRYKQILQNHELCHHDIETQKIFQATQILCAASTFLAPCLSVLDF